MRRRRILVTVGAVTLVAAALSADAIGRPAPTTSEIRSVVVENLSAATIPTIARPPDSPLSARLVTRVFESAALKRTMPYVVYLPPGYEYETDRLYPTVYLLHGMGGSDRQWMDVGVVDVAERMIRAGEIEPLLIVLPEGERSYWVDHANGGPRWGAYSAVDLVRDVEANYRVFPGSARRAIGGISMGAHGAIQLSLNYPDTFGAVGAHSLVLRRFGNAPSYFGDATEFARRDPTQLVNSRAKAARSLRLWIDIGDRDPWAPQARQFDRQLAQLDIAHEFREWPGDHSGEYWRAHTVEYLRFYNAALAGAVARN